jgi:hypothetical protein
MARVSVSNGLRLGVMLAVGLALAVTTAEATPRPRARRVLNLFSGFLGRQNVNRFDCGLNAVGMVCVDPGGSTTVGGGFWPKGTPDQYVFNSGLQLAGVVNPAISGFAWAGDTVGAFFFDPKGTTEHGDRLSLVWNSLDATDAANWPRDAYVPDDTSLYNPILIGLKSASQQDTWARYWDGNPNNNAGRKHPLGVLVDQRGMGWNFPSGNEDIIYYLYTFTNITASDGAVYAGQPDADSLTSYGTRFQTLNEAAFGVQIPDTGYTITEMYAAFAMDADVSDAARENYSTAFLPFSMGTAFKNNWYAPAMVFPSTIFGPPFAQAPGIVGVKYLKSPVVAGQEVGLTMFSNTINGGQFDDAQNTTQLWRYLSAKLDPGAGDAPCNNPGTPAVTKVCFVSQASDDIRFFQSSGPMDLKPGESKTIVVAYIAAAPVNVAQIAGRSQNFDLKPGFPAQPATMTTDSLRAVDKVFGAISVVGDTGGALGGGPNGKIDQNEVRTVPRSLLDKGSVAQAVFGARFLLPFPPAAPDFFLVPGNNQVTVVWKPSTTETDAVGDPYYSVAHDSTTVLYDPNYRQRDVEGYRIYRGRTAGALELVAQFDYTGTVFTDSTAAFDYGNCAPEWRVYTGCPVPVDTTPKSPAGIRRFTRGVDHPLVGPIVQIPPGGRVDVTDPEPVVITRADTALTGGGANGSCAPSVCPPLEDTGVPFSFVDRGVRNSFTYYYAVTAFDVNSVKSVGVGSTALESPRTAKTVTPRKSSNQVTGGGLQPVELIGGDGSVLTGTQPTIDPATGIFSGIAPPTDALDIGLVAFLPEVLQNGSVSVTIDSVVPGSVFGAAQPATYYLTAQGAGAPAQATLKVGNDQFDAMNTGTTTFPATAITTSKSTRFGGDSTFFLYGQATIQAPGVYLITSQGRAAVNSTPPNSEHTGPRWWAGAANENTNDPNGILCVPADVGCVLADLSRNAGGIAGVQIFSHLSYTTVQNLGREFEGVGAGVTRAADMRVYWGATAGSIDSVVDLTHKVKVPFSPKIRASWGILNDSSFIIPGTAKATLPDTSIVKMTWTDIYCVDPVPAYIGRCAVGGVQPAPAVLQDHARLNSVVFRSSTIAGSTGLTATPATGTGFIFYINGHSFLMQTATLPSATTWNVRFFSGNITGSPGSYAFQPGLRPAAVPGLRARVSFEGSTLNQTTTTDAQLALVHTVPDPYYVTNALEQSPNSKKLRFVNLPSQAIVRIYSLSGVLVQVLTLNDATGGGEVEWNLRNRNNQFVASGVYFYHVEAPDGKTKVGRFTVVNFAQ